LAAQNFLDSGSVDYVVPSDVPLGLVFFVPITTGSTYIGTHKLVERDNSLPGALRREECKRLDIDGQGPVPEVGRHIQEGFNISVSGVVDEDIEPRPRLDRGGNRGLGRACLRQIADHRNALGPELTAEEQTLLHASGVQIGNGDLAAAASEVERQMASKAAARAGDEHARRTVSIVRHSPFFSSQ
jgi:hypothetical protein